MWLSATAVYWSCASIVGYTYLGYPLAIYALGRLRPNRPRREPIRPTVSVVLAARNEAERIGIKIENLLELDYPMDRLQIIVVSDGSTDGTDRVVQGFAGRGVLFERVDTPSGKPTALNRGVARASGEIVLFCDTRQRIDPAALTTMVELFADPNVGAVSGALDLPRDKGPGLYWAYEKRIRAAESELDSVVGATGALYAIRRQLYRPLPANCLVDDVYTPMQIVLAGYRVIYEPEARVYDSEADNAGEFSRKARTLAGNFQLIEQLPLLLNPRRNRLWVQLVSHKLMRLTCPVALAGLYASNVLLVASLAPGWPFYCGTLLAQTAGYALAARGATAKRPGRLARASYTFVNLNLAALEGFRRYLTGQLDWTTARQA